MTVKRSIPVRLSAEGEPEVLMLTLPFGGQVRSGGALLAELAPGRWAVTPAAHYDALQLRVQLAADMNMEDDGGG